MPSSTYSFMLFQRFTPRVPMLNVWTSQTSHFRALSAWALLSVYSAYFPNGTVKKESAGVWVPHTEFLHAVPTQCSIAFSLGNCGEGLLRQPFTPPRHPGNSYFLLAIFSSSDVCLGLKKMEGLPIAALDHQSCKDPINLNQDHLHLISEPGSVRRQRQHHSAPE